MTPARWAALAALVFALYFAVQGGEYGTTDLIHLRREESSERTKVLRLRTVVDSLTRAAVAIERDPRVQERAAREQFGMLRKGEFLYRIVPADSAPQRGHR
ncbi:MAG TPA: septum formation initiator family protein [Gemmatimonadales bacterium]